jgi:acetoin utilization protein AcuA
VQLPRRRKTALNDSIQKELVRKPLPAASPSGPSARPKRSDPTALTISSASHAQYKSIYTKRETLEKHAGKKDANVVLALTESQQIVGFGVFSHPDPDDRWTELGPGVMMEVKAVEVSRPLRSCRIAGDLVRLMLAHPKIEQMIAYMVGYSWTWDLDGSKLTAQQYRNMLIRLFNPHGFIELQTNEPNICLKPENLFMGRIGSEVTGSGPPGFQVASVRRFALIGNTHFFVPEWVILIIVPRNFSSHCDCRSKPLKPVDFIRLLFIKF